MEDVTPTQVLPRGSRLIPDKPAVFHVLSGRVRYLRITDSGHAASVGVLGSGEAFVYRRPWLPGSPGASIEALEETRLLVLREREVPTFVSAHPELASRLLVALARRAGDMTEMACDLALEDARRRVVRTLIRLADRHGQPEEDGPFHRILVPLKHQDLAALVGACRETVTSVLGDLSRRGAVRTGRCAIAVNRERALDLLEEDAG